MIITESRVSLDQSEVNLPHSSLDSMENDNYAFLSSERTTRKLVASQKSLQLDSAQAPNDIQENIDQHSATKDSDYYLSNDFESETQQSVAVVEPATFDTTDKKVQNEPGIGTKRKFSLVPFSSEANNEIVEERDSERQQNTTMVKQKVKVKPEKKTMSPKVTKAKSPTVPTKQIKTVKKESA